MSDSLANSLPLSPLTFTPRLVPKMWGGSRLASLGKDIPDEPIGESWEIYDFPPGVVDDSSNWDSASVTNGALAGRTLHELMSDNEMRRRILGSVAPVNHEAGSQFPLLVKFLDAEQDLSVQVHPDADYARKHDGADLKNEAWYVLAHEPNARLLKGLEPGVTRQSFEQAIADGSVKDLLTSLPARLNECHYLPSGTVHSLGAGMLVAEVQTPSDTTFRVYDFKRKDPKTGKERELHVEQAMQCIDFEQAGQSPFPPTGTGGEDGVLAQSPQFTIARKSERAGGRHELPIGQPSVLIFVEGSGQVQCPSADAQRFARGTTMLLPAELRGAAIDAETDCRWLLVSFGP